MRRDPVASYLSTRGAVHLMNRAVRAPNREIPPVPQASWRRNHDMAQNSRPKSAPLRWTCPVSISMKALGRSRLSKKFASFQSGGISRLPYERSVAFLSPKRRTPWKSRLCFSKGTCVQLLRINSTVHWRKQTTNHSRPKAHL